MWTLGMGQGLTIAARNEITKKYARAYAWAAKKDKGRMLDELVAVTGWSRANARRAIGTAALRKGAARAVVRKPRAPTYGYDTLKVLIEIWTLVGEPCGKYLAPVMADSLAQLEAFGELAQVSHRLNDVVLKAAGGDESGHDRPDAAPDQTGQVSGGEVRDSSWGCVAVLYRGASGDG